MNKRAAKKRAKLWIDWFTREKIPAAFNTEQQRREYCAAWARMRVDQKGRLPETLRVPKRWSVLQAEENTK